MKLAITPSNQDLTLVLFDTETQKTKFIKSEKDQFNKNADDSRPLHRPFGITWNKEKIFIASRKNLLVFDNRLNYIGKHENILDENTHQITYYDGKIIATMTRKDCVLFINLEKNKQELYHPIKGWITSCESLSHENEQFHINSLNVTDGFLYVMLHNRGVKNSEILVLDMRLKSLVKIINMKAKRAHGIYAKKEVLGTLNTNDNNIVIKNKIIDISIPKNHFLRGMAGDDNEICFAHFKENLRSYRGEGGSYIKTLSGKSGYIDGIGSVNDMRRIDGVDLCHNNKYKFPYVGSF
tara:strand:- start:1201 stop:2085 length:885 start_codon:yes stop_codon:yes gene_type:complete